MYFDRSSLLALAAIVAASQALGEEQPSAAPRECSKFVPAINKTVTVPCDEASPAAPGSRDTTAIPPAGEEQLVTFDTFAPGLLPEDALASQGIPKLRGSHPTGVYKAEPNMVLPAGRSRVLLIAGGPETSLWITFTTPIKRFSLTRIGTAGGASVPTWTLRAFDAKGAVVASTGEEHGLPSEPRQFSTEGSAIAVVRLRTDNRFGTGTWATWNSLPVAEFRILR